MKKRQPEFLSPLITEELLGSKYASLFRPFGFYSAVLGREIWGPVGFIFDYESVPVVKGTSKRGGAGHDLLCRIDSDPVVSKKLAADVYLEMMACRDALLFERDMVSVKTARQKALVKIKTVKRRCRRQTKYWVVRAWPGYFHKFTVTATLEEISRG